MNKETIIGVLSAVILIGGFYSIVNINSLRNEREALTEENNKWYACYNDGYDIINDLLDYTIDLDEQYLSGYWYSDEEEAAKGREADRINGMVDRFNNKCTTGVTGESA